MLNSTVKYGEYEVQYGAARWRWRVVNGIIAVSQCHIHRVFETAHVVFKVSQGHVPGSCQISQTKTCKYLLF